MPTYDTFHERQARARASGEDVYIYDKIPNPLRVQIVQLMERAIGGEDAYNKYGSYGDNVTVVYRSIVLVLREALGMFLLPPRSEYEQENFLEELREWLLAEKDAERFMSGVELVCRLIQNRASMPNYRGKENAAEIAEKALADINYRIRQHGIGYEYDGEIIRIDSELVHAEAVKPALALLRDPLYATAQDEFLKAHEHFRAGDTKDALTNALKAFESTMKIIGTKRGWTFDQKDTAKQLIDMCYREGLIPEYWQTHFSGLRSVLEAGIPTARNRAGGHGAGATPQNVPDHLASYVLHMTASTIVFLVNADKALP